MRRLRFCLRGCAGISAPEVMAVLTALSAMSALAAPAITDAVERAQLVRARHDVSTLGVALVRLFNDVGSGGTIERGWATFDLLVGAGARPAAGSTDALPWIAPIDAHVGRLDDHLIRNAPGYPRRGRFLGWNGAYLQHAVRADPWGHRYAVNVRAMRKGSWDTVVLSAGPDGVIESPFEMDGLPTRGDDIVALVSASGTLDVPEPQPGGEPRVRVILHGGRRRAALVGRRVVGVGDVLDSGTIVRVRPDAIVVESSNGRRRTVRLGARLAAP